MHLRLIRLLGLAGAALTLAACATYEATVGAIGEGFAAPAQTVPEIDLSNARWQKLAPEQPDANPVRAAIVARDEKIGATRVVLKVPPAFALPPYWLTAEGTYTVLQGTFVFETIDAKGRPGKLTQSAGAFARVPRNLIQRAATKEGEEGLLYITVYGDWAPKFAEGAWSGPSLRAGS